MSKYTVNYLDRRGRPGRVGVSAETPAAAIERVKTEYSERYYFGFASITVISVDLWQNGYVRVWERGA